MGKNEYTEQQKADAVKRAVEIGVQAAAKELGIPSLAGSCTVEQERR